MSIIMCGLYSETSNSLRRFNSHIETIQASARGLQNIPEREVSAITFYQFGSFSKIGFDVGFFGILLRSIVGWRCSEWVLVALETRREVKSNQVVLVFVSMFIEVVWGGVF